jgi:ribosomal protein S18 acetylase RimI-like enzyme
MVVNMLHGTRALFGKIDDVATHPDSRRQGHAGVVLDYALEWFRNRGAEMVMLDSEDDRQPAHRLYESRGFKRYETNQFHLDLS